MKRTMYQAARHTPKRNAVRSSRAGGAKNDRCKPAKTGLQRFFIIYHDWAAARLTVAP